MDFIYEGVNLVAVIMAVAECMKLTGFNKKYIPLINITLGLLGGVIYLNPYHIKLGILQGLIMGLTASGLYSSVKNIKEGIGKDVI